MTEKGTSNQNNEAKTPETEPWTSSKPSRSRWLKVPRFFSDPDVHPFEQIEWENRHPKITGDTGEVILNKRTPKSPSPGASSLQKWLSANTSTATSTLQKENPP